MSLNRVFKTNHKLVLIFESAAAIIDRWNSRTCLYILTRALPGSCFDWSPKTILTPEESAKGQGQGSCIWPPSSRTPRTWLRDLRCLDRWTICKDPRGNACGSIVGNVMSGVMCPCPLQFHVKMRVGLWPVARVGKKKATVKICSGRRDDVYVPISSRTENPKIQDEILPGNHHTVTKGKIRILIFASSV